MSINENTVGKAVGAPFALKSYSNGNIQATIKDLKSTGPYDVICLLKEAAEALVANGLVSDPNDCVRLSWNTQKKDENGQDIWKPFPQLWVNQPSKTQVALEGNSTRVETLEANVTQIMSMFQKMLEGQTPSAPEKSEALPVQGEDPF